MTDKATDVALPTTFQGWNNLAGEVARRIEETGGASGSVAFVFGPEAAAGFDEFAVADAVDSLSIIAEATSRGTAPSEAIAAILATHLRMGVEMGLFLAERGVRLP